MNDTNLKGYTVNTALLLIDVQNDFFPGGDLPTPEGDSIVGPVNRLIDMFQDESLPIYATRDWHPEDHCSFEEQGGEWPRHCVRNTEGAEFKPEIKLPKTATIISKAESPERDAYSGFDKTTLADRLREQDVKSLVVAGLATDVCVKYSVLDALDEGFDVTVVREAVSGVEAEPGDSERAIEEMKDKGAAIVSVTEVAL